MSEKNSIPQMNVITGTDFPEPLVIKANNHTTGQINFNPTDTTTIWPNYQPYYQYPSYNYVQPAWVSINKAQNGFIVVKNGQTFVCKNVEEITELLLKKD